MQLNSLIEELLKLQKLGYGGLEVRASYNNNNEYPFQIQQASKGNIKDYDNTAIDIIYLSAK